MLRPLLCTFALALAQPVLADAESDYARLSAALPGLSFGFDAADQMTSLETLLGGVEGRWVNLVPLMQGGTEFPPPDMVTTACDKIGLTFARVGKLGLDVTYPKGEPPFRIHLQAAGGMTFLGNYDDTGLTQRVFGDRTDIQPDIVFNALVRSEWLGYLTIHSAGPDLLLIEPLARPAGLFARCN